MDGSSFSSMSIIHDFSLVFLSTSVFLVLRSSVPYFIPTPSALKVRKPSDTYMWYNVIISLFHSFVTGIWCLLCFYSDPQLARDLIERHEWLAHTLVAFSTGYFVYDFIEQFTRFPFSKSWEIALHHCVVTSCFGVSVFLRRYVGYAVVALLVEVNSVFLHIRQLQRVAQIPQNNPVYRINCMLNLATFVVFRICTLTWMTRWIVLNRHVIPQPYHTIGVIGMAVMTVMNTTLFVRLINRDCFGRDDKKLKK